MDPVTAGMIGASAISAAGSVGGSLWSASASKDAVKRQIKAQLYMSNTAYQRGICLRTWRRVRRSISRSLKRLCRSIVWLRRRQTRPSLVTCGLT